MPRALTLPLALLFALSSPSPTPAEDPPADRHRVLLELFTSQG